MGQHKQVIDEVGKVYGKLRVTGFKETRGRAGAHWLAFCDPNLGGCGKTNYVVRGNRLRTKQTTHCGCSRKRSRRPNERIKQSIYSHSRRGVVIQPRKKVHGIADPFWARLVNYCGE